MHHALRVGLVEDQYVEQRLRLTVGSEHSKLVLPHPLSRLGMYGASRLLSVSKGDPVLTLRLRPRAADLPQSVDASLERHKPQPFRFDRQSASF